VELKSGWPHLSSKHEGQEGDCGGQQGFVNGKLCLTNLIAGHFVTEGSVDGRESGSCCLSLARFLTFSSTTDEVWAR